MFRCLKILWDSEDIRLEPSALAGIASVFNFHDGNKIKAYCSRQAINPENIAHLSWATGGNMVPESVMKGYYVINS